MGLGLIFIHYDNLRDTNRPAIAYLALLGERRRLQGWSWGTGSDPTAGSGGKQAVTFQAQPANCLPWALGHVSEVMIALCFRRALPVAQTSDT